MRLGAFEVSEPLPELNRTHALVMLQPWVDVGGVGTLTLSWLESCLRAKDLARLSKPGDFFDFTRYRPTVFSSEGRRQVIVPNAYITYSQQDTGHDFLFLHLLEPHSHAEIYVESLLQLLKKFDVKRYCLIGSMYDYVPHTKPIIVTGSANGKEAQSVLERLGIEPSSYQGPTTILTLITQSAPDVGMETMSLIVHLPQYTQLEEDFSGASRLIEVLSSVYDLPQEKTYIEKAQKQLEEINQALDKNPQLKALVKDMEDQYEVEAEGGEERRPPKLSPEVEKFLSDMEKRFKEN
jgi:predicted ATP-grasp superfamily ATP-dependent carboligase